MTDTSQQDWAGAWRILLRDLHSDQTELAELESAVFLAEEQALITGGNPKTYTAQLRADKAKATARLWITKAKIDFVQTMVGGNVPYDITLDPSV